MAGKQAGMLKAASALTAGTSLGHHYVRSYCAANLIFYFHLLGICCKFLMTCNYCKSYLTYLPEMII